MFSCTSKDVHCHCLLGEGRNCKLTSLTQLENNFPSYIRATSELISDSISEELATTQTIYEERTLFHCIDSICSNALITSLQSYKLLLKEFHLPSISYLRKMKQGNLKILKSAKMLLDFNSISKDVVLMFDEMYLQKREEYAGGELVGADTDGNLYKGIVCFMIVGFNLT